MFKLITNFLLINIYQHLVIRQVKDSNALARINKFMSIQQRILIINSFIFSQFGYCPLVWMFCSRHLNNKINRIHYRALKMIYDDVIELYKVAYGPKIIKKNFPTRPEIKSPWENIFQTFNVNTTS